MRQILIFAAFLLIVALLADAWHAARQDNKKLTATIASQNNSIQQAADREKQRDAQLAATISKIEAEKRSVHTPQQAAQKLSAAFPDLPLPITVHIPNLSNLAGNGPQAETESGSQNLRAPENTADATLTGESPEHEAAGDNVRPQSESPCTITGTIFSRLRDRLRPSPGSKASDNAPSPAIEPPHTQVQDEAKNEAQDKTRSAGKLTVPAEEKRPPQEVRQQYAPGTNTRDSQSGDQPNPQTNPRGNSAIDTQELSLSVPTPDLVPLYDQLQTCRASEAKIAALQQDLSDEKARSTALEHERQQAVTASRGGSTIARVKQAAKWFLIGAVAATAAAKLTTR